MLISEPFTLWIGGRLPGLNDLLGAKSHQSRRSGWNAYNEAKQTWSRNIGLLARHIKPHGPGFATFIFCEPDKRRDPDNVLAGGTKIILDALVTCGAIPSDDWKGLLGLQSYWLKRETKPGVMVHWAADGHATLLDMMELL